ncbi:MAG: right-handed parallel beta-helix repeat-containing protein [Planctomycetia bacterium]|nr:right-handed parallel beta-helix repeat-containing protein [Planctomycetia bacterium]
MTRNKRFLLLGQSFTTHMFSVMEAIVVLLSFYYGMNLGRQVYSQSTPYESPATFYVDVAGSDSWSGKLDAPNATHTDGPVATLERARELVREHKSQLSAPATIVVEVLSGVYDLPTELTFTAEDSGASQDCPVIWRARQGECVQVNAGSYLHNPKRLESNEIRSLLKENIRDDVIEYDLVDYQVEKLHGGVNAPLVYYQDEPMRLARYPNEGFVKISDLPTEDVTDVDVRGTRGIAEGKFFFDDPEILKCVNEKDLWVHGYWFWDWSEQKSRVASIDVDAKLITLEPPFHIYGYRKGQWFYVFNALSQLDLPGEYYVDVDLRKVYCLPTVKDWENASLLISRLPHALCLSDVTNFIWHGFDMVGASDDVIYSKGVLRNVEISCCDIHSSGAYGVTLSGVNCRVAQCEMWNLGAGGISLSGGDRTTLTPGNMRAEDNYIHDYAVLRRVYAPGIRINGVGNYAGHNTIENAPHMGMGFSGNDMVLEFNELSNVCSESNDAGAIYVGRNWTMRGNVIRHNYLHDITGFEGRGCVGVYLDDMFSSADIVGNLFVNVTRAAFIGGGRDCKINENLFVNCHPALHIDARGDGWAHDHIDSWLEEARTKGTISGIKYNEEPYASRYPELATILDPPHRPQLPEGNQVVGNICVGGSWDVNKQGQWQGDTIESKARELLKMENNYVVEEVDDALFVDASNGDYHLREDTDLTRKGYASLPIEQMGVLQKRMRDKVALRRAR